MQPTQVHAHSESITYKKYTHTVQGRHRATDETATPTTAVQKQPTLIANHTNPANARYLEAGGAGGAESSILDLEGGVVLAVVEVRVVRLVGMVVGQVLVDAQLEAALVVP